MIYTSTFMNLSLYSNIPSYVTNASYNNGAQYERFRAVRPFAGKQFDTRRMMAEVIKESKEDSFVFILTNTQLESFKAWIEQYKLEEFEVFRMARPVTNGNHPKNGRNLTMVVFASKEHVWRDMFEDETECI